MGYFAGLDVSLEETAVCVVDDAGRILREARVASEPEALVAFFAACRDDDETAEGHPEGQGLVNIDPTATRYVRENVVMPQGCKP